MRAEWAADSAARQEGMGTWVGGGRTQSADGRSRRRSGPVLARRHVAPPRVAPGGHGGVALTWADRHGAAIQSGRNYLSTCAVWQVAACTAFIALHWLAAAPASSRRWSGLF